MTDPNTGQTVECAICGTSFDPTVAGGWCTNTDCGEWQYTDDGEGAIEDDDEPEQILSIPESDDESDADGSQPADADAESVGASAVDADAEPGVPDDEPKTEGAADVAEGDADGPSESADDAEPAELTDAEPSETDDDEPDNADDQSSTIDCPDCGSTLDGDVNFCPDCGADVQDVDPDAPLTACPSCDTDVDPEDNFCVNCGEDLEAHRNGEVDTDDAADADDTEPRNDAEAEDAVDALESADETPVPDSLVIEIEGREIAVADGDTVGREIRAALTDAGRPEDEAVRIHREHVRFVREDDSFYLLDLGDNPTALNGKTLQKGDREPIGPGDELELSGVATVTVRAP